MQIHGPSHVHGTQHIHGAHQTRSAESAASPTSHSVNDQLDISEAARLHERMAEIPDIREERVAEIRAQLARGAYETDEKLDMALERLLDEIA